MYIKRIIIIVHYSSAANNISYYDGHKNCIITILGEWEEESEILIYHNRKSLGKINIDKSGKSNIIHII